MYLTKKKRLNYVCPPLNSPLRVGKQLPLRFLYFGNQVKLMCRVGIGLCAFFFFSEAWFCFEQTYGRSSGKLENRSACSSNANEFITVARPTTHPPTHPWTHHFVCVLSCLMSQRDKDDWQPSDYGDYMIQDRDANKFSSDAMLIWSCVMREVLDRVANGRHMVTDKPLPGLSPHHPATHGERAVARR